MGGGRRVGGRVGESCLLLWTRRRQTPGFVVQATETQGPSSQLTVRPSTTEATDRLARLAPAHNGHVVTQMAGLLKSNSHRSPVLTTLVMVESVVCGGLGWIRRWAMVRGWAVPLDDGQHRGNRRHHRAACTLNANVGTRIYLAANAVYARQLAAKVSRV